MLAVVFDMDGVLFDTQKVYSKTWIEVAGILGINEIEEPLFHCIGRNRADQEIILKKYYPDGFPFDEFYRLKNKIFDRHIEEDGIPLMKGTKELLMYLNEAGAKLAIASSSRKDVIMHHIHQTGLSGMFHKIIGGDMVAHSKPNPDIYLKACDELGVDTEKTFAVEDSYNGIRAAASAGMKTIMIPDMQPPTKEMDELLFKRFNDLIELMEYFKTINV